MPCSYQERALRILEMWLSPADLHPSSLRAMINDAYSSNFQHAAIAPVVKLNDQFYVHELFHGPTASFKDLALQLTPRFFSEGISRRSATDRLVKFLILVATSGDTGSAVLEGFKGNTIHSPNRVHSTRDHSGFFSGQVVRPSANAVNCTRIFTSLLDTTPTDNVTDNFMSSQFFKMAEYFGCFGTVQLKISGNVKGTRVRH